MCEIPDGELNLSRWCRFNTDFAEAGKPGRDVELIHLREELFFAIDVKSQGK